MKVLVAIKRVVDYNVKVRAKADGTDVDLNNVKMAWPSIRSVKSP
jgi:electron transfer flavoprotein beta subunit